MLDGKKIVTILGSTGSIGIQTLQVLENLWDTHRIGFLTANYNIDLLAEQIRKYKPIGVVVKDRESCAELKRKINNSNIKCGKENLLEAASDIRNDIVISALVGFSGVEPSLAAIESGINIALANKETLVSAGSIITEAVKRNKVELITIDSEHSAILQCLVGEDINEVEKIILTASGGPFLNTPKENFAKLTVKEALSHPNWSMGNKITIDSATMMNKGFEVIEAFWLFNIAYKNIQVMIHPQSIIHSLVQFVDGSVKAQLGLPDMRIPISYSLNYPRRMKFNFPRLDLSEIAQLTFIKPDFEKFPCLKLAYHTLDIGGTAPAILNAANEIAVEYFINEKITFTDIPLTIEYALSKIDVTANPSLSIIIETDKETRNLVKKHISNRLLKK
jgi:1-deoxy-D-xylulose-5-phosphate reductoisomerase